MLALPWLSGSCFAAWAEEAASLPPPLAWFLRPGLPPSGSAAETAGGVATLAPCCELKREAGSGVGALPRLARASDGADASGVDSKLRPVP